MYHNPVILALVGGGGRRVETSGSVWAALSLRLTGLHSETLSYVEKQTVVLV